MSDVLVYFGTDPHLLGVATIGGILSLAFLIWTVSRSLYRSRIRFFESRRERRISQIKLFMSDIRLAKRMKNVGFSDLIIAERHWRLAFYNSLSFIMVMGLGIFNAITTKYGEFEVFSGSVSFLSIFVAFLFLRAAHDTFNRAIQIVRAAAFGDSAFVEIALFKRELRRKWFP